jgi:D-serine deaminase-like pyridoxal phosphate-dependent protein
MRVQDVPTPALLLDLSAFEANIQRMTEDVKGAGKALRPHAKAHKCVSIARRQIAAGAVGVCVATVPEAEIMASAGIGSLLLTSPIADPAKCTRIARLGEMVPDIAVVVDHADQVRLYSAATRTPLKVLIDLDVGDHRTGIAPGQLALELAQLVLAQRNLLFRGLQAYSVRASHLSAADGLAAFSSSALQHAAETKELLERNGIACPTISGGSTGSYAVDSQLPYMTELQAGSYALMDVAYGRIGIDRFYHAMTVMATVISANYADRITVDAGFKAFATDRAFGPDLHNLPGGRYQWAGDEFGFVLLGKGQTRPKLGDRLEFIPPHCDPTVNLYDRIYVRSGDTVIETWPIMDRYHAG